MDAEKRPDARHSSPTVSGDEQSLIATLGHAQIGAKWGIDVPSVKLR